MENIIEALKEELSKQYNELAVLSFIGFVKTQSDIIAKLEKDFNSGLAYCLEIINQAKGK